MPALFCEEINQANVVFKWIKYLTSLVLGFYLVSDSTQTNARHCRPQTLNEAALLSLQLPTFHTASRPCSRCAGAAPAAVCPGSLLGQPLSASAGTALDPCSRRSLRIGDEKWLKKWPKATFRPRKAAECLPRALPGRLHAAPWRPLLGQTRAKVQEYNQSPSAAPGASFRGGRGGGGDPRAWVH